MPKPPTIRSLARTLGLSVATVSEALRDSPRVTAPTRERVKRAAERAGYQRNPLLGATLSALRRSRHQGFSGVLALVDVTADERTELMLFHREVARGAEARAQALGFRTELFWIGPKAPALSVARLNGVLRARGIHGVIFLPFDRAQDFSGFELDQLAAVGMDHRLLNPSLHTIQADHYLSMRRALQQLTDRGYRRIGLCLEGRKDERVDSKWSSGFLSFFRLSGRKLAVPPLIVPKLDTTVFQTWFRQHRPDLIIGHEQAIVDWLAARRLRVPEDVGFFRINVTERSKPCAGLDLMPQRLGATAVETVVGMLHRREQGIPPHPNSISIDALFVDGPTLRPA
jgi:DNA-binding LacI/PurR family transcriptional regulator